MKKFILTIAFTALAFTNSFGSHLMGGEITYTYVSGNDYEVTLIVYRDCNGITVSTSQTVTFESASCGQNFDFSIPFIQTTDISQVCAGQPTTCNGGTTPGTQQYVFKGIVTLPPCSDWIMHWDNGSRNASISNLVSPSSENIYIQNTLNNIIGVNNNSPQFFNSPTPYLCANNLAIYSHAASDPDGDSLYYSFNNPLGTPGPPGIPISFTTGYSVNQPISTVSGINFDQTTGEMCFTPDIGQIVVISVLIEEYRNGILIGSQIREMQVVVDPSCTNQNPTTGPSASCGGAAALNLTIAGPSVSQTDLNSVVMCPNDDVCFEVVFSDPDGDNITVNDNIAAAIPTATFTVVGNGTPNPIGTFCWTPTPLDSGLNVFSLIAIDDACPISGTQSFVFDVTVFDQPYAGLDDTICGSQTAQLQASGGINFSWSVISGDPIVVGTNFSCINCSNPLASPSITTTYLLTSGQAASCSITDTVTVNVVPDFTPTVSQSSPSACLFDPIQLDVAVIPVGTGYSYSWSPSTFLSADNIANPIANIMVPGNHTYYVDIISPGGCLKTDSIDITIVAFVAPDITILTPDSNMACGDSILIDLDLGGGIPALSGPSLNNNCSGPTSQNIVGIGTTNISSYPTPYNGFWHDGRVQIIYTPAEIIAAGFIGGKITEMGWFITQVGGQTYDNFTIKMGVPPVNDFSATSTFIPGMTQVFTTPNFAPTGTGWTTHTLNTAYDWNGVSNLLIEICFDNTGYTSRDEVAQTTTSSKMVLFDYADNSSGCTLSSPNSGNDQFNRPNIRFTSCPTTPDPLAFNYSWTPNTSIITSTMQNPTVFPSQPTTYTVTVSDLAGNCSDTDSLTVTVLCGACYQPAITITNPTCKDGTDGKLIIDPNYVLGSEIQSYTWKDSITNVVLQTTLNLTGGMRDSLINISAGAYTISFVDTSGCSQDTTIWLTEPDSVVINNLTSDSLICIGGSKMISATAIGGSGINYSYTWTDLSTGTNIPGNGPHSVSPIISPTCYSVMAADDLGCISNTQQMCISLYPNIIASTTNDTLKICPNTSTPIDINAIGGSGTGYNYDWYESGTLVGNGTIINVTPSNSNTTYTGVVTDNCSTPSDSINVVIEWVGLVIPDFTRNKPDSCYPVTVQFDNTSTPANLVATSEWTFSDGTVITGNSVPRTFNSPGCQDLTLLVTTIDGCIVDTTKPNFVCPFDYPTSDFYANPDVADLLNTEISFVNESSGAAPLSYLWSFNSGLNPDSSTETNPIFEFPNNAPNQYPVNLEVRDKNGCVTAYTSTVIINGIYLFYVPNSFTPDGDGKNDVFKPSGSGIDLTKYNMKIFNSWGKLIFSTNDATQGWDGTYKGKNVPNGTYVWKINSKEKFAPTEHKNIGHINLIR